MVDFNILPDGHIVFSDMHQFLDRASVPAEEFLRYAVATDGKASLSVTHIGGGSRAGSKDEFSCPIPEGMRFVW